MKYCFRTKDFIQVSVDDSKLAISGSNGNLTWGEFKGQVGTIIDFFNANGLANDFNPIIIYGHKNTDMLTAIYACMSMNIPYIPVDDSYPNKRVEKIIGAAQCNLIINTTGEPQSQFSATCLNLHGELSLDSKNKKYKSQTNNTLDLVYIIFTSGSTGEPKGVQISNEAVQSFTKWMTSADFNFTSSDIFINTALLSFDLSVFEVMTFGALGASLILNTKAETANQDVLLDKIKNYQASIWVSTPSFAFLYSRLDADKRLNSVKSFLFCGEILPHSLASELVVKYGNATVVNTYGPTEATVATTILTITPAILATYNPLPVGYSKMDTEVIIDNEEIVIIGPNVSAGYINRPDLNPKKFVTIKNQKAFKTGDKGYIKDGLLFFNGRNDDMVKLHGYRIEINEITSVLHNLPYVLQAATVTIERGGVVKKIVSLVQLKAGENKTSAQMKADLQSTLPDYMVPADIKVVDSIPLNQNGKADKKALIAIYLGRPTSPAS